MLDTSHFFDTIFKNVKLNAMLIMNGQGIIIKINEAFSTAYGYSNENLESKNFRMLYTEKDQVTLRPEIELNIIKRQGFSTDENYLVHKDGTHIWVSGESVLVDTGNDTRIVKIIHNIHAQKQLER